LPVLATAAERMEPGGVITYAAADGEDLVLPDPLDGRRGHSSFQRPVLPAQPAHSVRETVYVADLEDAAARQRLAEEMRRILVEDARRHGIDV
jgi:hypothetical protein